MSDGAEEQFVAEGIQRYAQALETIRAFETMLGDRLREVVNAYTSTVFSGTKSTTKNGTSAAAFGVAVWVTQKGTLKSTGEVSLELGLWWRDEKVAYYCGFADNNNKPIGFKYTRHHPRVEFNKWSSKARLFMLASKDPSAGLDQEFKIVLDELTGSFQ